MALQKLSDGSGIVLSIGSGKTDKKYINNHGKKAELQTLWLFTDEHSLPNTKYVKADDTSLSLTVPINQDDSTFEFFTRLDSLIEETVTDSAVHKFIIKKNDQYYVRFKLYQSTDLFLGKQKQSVKSLLDFYNYLKPNTKFRLVFGFSHSWSMNGKTGFTATVKRVQLDEATQLDNNDITFYEE